MRSLVGGFVCVKKTVVEPTKVAAGLFAIIEQTESEQHEFLMDLRTLIETEENKYAGHHIPAHSHLGQCGIPMHIEQGRRDEKEKGVEECGHVRLQVQIHELGQGCHLPVQHQMAEGHGQMKHHKNAQHRE